MSFFRHLIRPNLWTDLQAVKRSLKALDKAKLECNFTVKICDLFTTNKIFMLMFFSITAIFLMSSDLVLYIFLSLLRVTILLLKVEHVIC